MEETTETIYGLVNAHMYGTAPEPGEGVDWFGVEYLYSIDFESWGLGDPASYAADNPHMIVFVVEQLEEEHPDSYVDDSEAYSRELEERQLGRPLFPNEY